MNNKILVTGGAGFIGFHLINYLLDNNPTLTVVSVDNINEYYDKNLKLDRLKKLAENHKRRYRFIELDICDDSAVKSLFKRQDFDIVINLAAQAGVRYAKEYPESYIRSNLNGFFNIANNCANNNIDKFIYASSSSVYGANTAIPFKETDKCTSPMSLYAATKLCNENIAASYYYSSGLKSVGLRFFNVYGPWGRPDMAYYKWALALLKGEEIELRDDGNMYRDMTYVDDVTCSINKLLFDTNWAGGHEIYNIGNEKPVCIKDMLGILQDLMHVRSNNIVNVSRGSEEPIKTYAETNKLWQAIDYKPTTSVDIGLEEFTKWFKVYHHSK